MYDRCSSESYDQLKRSGDLGKAQAMYLSVFMDYRRPMTHLEATRKVYEVFGKTMPARNGRIAELEERGFLKKFDVVPCDVTKKNVNRWWWTGRTQPYETKTEWRTCKHCQGKGGKLEKFYYQSAPQGDLFS